MRFVYFAVACLLLLFNLNHTAYSQDEAKTVRKNVVKDLNDVFLVYDNEYETYVPFVKSQHQYFNTLNFWISKSEYNGYVLSFKTSPDLCLFINQKLYGFYTDVREVEIDLNRIDISKDNKQLFITFYHPRSAYNAVNEPHLIYKQPVDAVVYKQVAANSNYSLLQRTNSPLQSWITIFFLGLVALYVLIRNTAPSLFFSFFTLDRLSAGSLDEYSGAIKKSWSREIFLIIIVNSLCLGFILLLVQPDSRIADIFQEGIFDNIFQFTATYLRYVMIGLIYFLLKFSLLYFVGFLFRINIITNAHYYEFIRFTTISSVLLLLLTFVQYNSFYLSHDLFLRIAIYSIIGLIALRILKIAFVLNSSLSFRNLYLFSYLCATEIIPILIIAKYYQFD